MMKRLLLVAVLAAPLVGRADGPAAPLDGWADRNPDAARSLESWIRAHREAATRIFHWDLDHPRRADVFFGWVAAHPDETLESFAATHADWPVTELVLKRYAPAVRELFGWIHDHRVAVEELGPWRRGFAWLGVRYYRQLWRSPLTEPDWNQPLDPEPQPKKNFVPQP